MMNNFLLKGETHTSYKNKNSITNIAFSSHKEKFRWHKFQKGGGGSRLRKFIWCLKFSDKQRGMEIRKNKTFF